MEWIKSILSTEVKDIIIPALALLVSALLLVETKKSNRNMLQARIIFNIVQQDRKLYLSIRNIGQLLAFDVRIKIDGGPQNPAKSLRIIPPGTIFRYFLVDVEEIASYPNLQQIKICAEFKDSLCLKGGCRNAQCTFPILELLKYTCIWNEKQQCYDIERL